MHVAASVVAFVVGAFAQQVFQAVRKVMRRPTPLEMLKNALLSYALLKHGTVDDSPVNNYASFDGSVLPAFSGYSTSNTCFSYIQSDHDRMFGPFPSRIMNDKHAAIVKYLERNLATTEQIVDLFEKFSGVATNDTTTLVRRSRGRHRDGTFWFN